MDLSENPFKGRTLLRSSGEHEGDNVENKENTKELNATFEKPKTPVKKNSVPIINTQSIDQPEVKEAIPTGKSIPRTPSSQEEDDSRGTYTLEWFLFC